MHRGKGSFVLRLVLGSLLLAVVWQVAAIAAPQGTLSFSWPEEFRAIDPHRHDNQRVFWAIIGKNVFDHLVERDALSNIVPGLATSWEAVTPTMWEFTLRQGVKFHNGEAFNAAVVKYTFDRMVRLTAPCLFLFDQIDRVEVVGDYAIRIYTKAPYGALLYSLTMAEMVPPVAGEQDSYATKPIGTGPFKVDQWVKDDRLVLVANEQYWGGAPKLAQAIHYPLMEAATRAAALKTGKIDIAHQLPAEEVGAIRATAGLQVVPVASNDTICLVFDHDKAWGDPRVREAAARAIDVSEIEKYILGEVGVAAKSAMAPSVFGFLDCSSEFPKYDLEEARELVKAAGYPNGFKTNIVAPAGFYPKDREICEYLKAQFAQIGIDLEIKLLVPASAWPILDSRDFELFIAGWGAATMDGDFALWRNYHSSSTREGFADPLLDQMLEIGRASGSQLMRQAVYGVAQVEIIQNVLRLPLYNPTRIYGISGRVQGFTPRGDENYDLRAVSVTGS
jgi:peptide/nickel transport system substrate-binding protein